MKTVKASFKFVIAEAIAAILTAVVLLIPIGALVFAGVYEPTALDSVIADVEALLVSGDIAVLGGAFLLILLVILIVNIYFLGAVSQWLWGWGKDHGKFRTGFKFVIIGGLVWGLRQIADTGLKLAIAVQYGSPEEFVAALQSGSTEALILLGVGLLIGIIGFLLLGFISRIVGWT